MNEIDDFASGYWAVWWAKRPRGPLPEHCTPAEVEWAADEDSVWWSSRPRHDWGNWWSALPDDESEELRRFIGGFYFGRALSGVLDQWSRRTAGFGEEEWPAVGPKHLCLGRNCTSKAPK